MQCAEFLVAKFGTSISLGKGSVLQARKKRLAFCSSISHNCQRHSSGEFGARPARTHRTGRKIRPLDLGHHSPKVMRASSFLICCRSFESVDSERRFANAKKRCFSASLEWSPASIKSTRTRFALVFRLFARARMCLAIREGRDTLCLTTFSVVAIAEL